MITLNGLVEAMPPPPERGGRRRAGAGVPESRGRNVREPTSPSAGRMTCRSERRAVRRPVRGATERARPARGDVTMRYLLLIYGPEPTEDAAARGHRRR